MKARGFTLIELMIVIAILAILVVIAYPSYQRHIEKTRRADAQSALLTASQAMERCFVRQNTYVGCTLPTYEGGTQTSPDGFYTLSFAPSGAGVPSPNPSPTAYVIRAVPGTQQSNDACGTFTLDHRGNRGAASADARCWGN